MAIVDPNDPTPYPSPFLDGTAKQFAWDSTSLGYLKECPRKYFYSMILRIGKAENPLNLRWGQIFHSALELFEKAKADGHDFDSAQRLMVRRVLEETWDTSVDPLTGEVRSGPWDTQAGLNKPSPKTREALIRSVIWHTEHYRNDNFRTVILANGKPAVELTYKFDIGNGLLLAGHLDRVVEDAQSNRFVLDHKTTTTALTPFYFKNYSPDNQMSGYSLAGSVIMSSPVRGVIIDGVQIQVYQTLFGRDFIRRSQVQLEEWLDHTRWWIAQAHVMAGNSHIQAQDAARWPMNDKSCHKFGGCPFIELCSSDPRVRPMIIKSNYIPREWNPLKPR